MIMRLQLASHNSHMRRRFDADADPLAGDAVNRDDNVVADD
jgi:hypothetical protein